MAKPREFNLFVYGTLRDPAVFRAVVGRKLATQAENLDAESFLARDAVLTGYKKISPDSTYLYAVPDAHGRIRGYIIGPLPPECMTGLRHYEGRNYARRTLTVQTSDGPEKAVVFLGNLKNLQHAFGYAFHDPFKQEVLLEKKIERALLTTEMQRMHTAELFTRRAIAELHGSTIRDLYRRHFEAGGISDYAILHSLLGAPLRDYSRVAKDPEARALAGDYLALVVRQVLFNQLEDRIHRDFRYELDRMNASGIYYERTVSCLAALRILNEHAEALAASVAEILRELAFPADHLIDFVRRAVIAADDLYDPRLARREIQYIAHHMGEGYIAIGAELEFSNIGHEVIRDPAGRVVRDPRYDGFLYFRDFGLDVLTWKLGGHLDDHHEKFSFRPRRGFFETALGSLSIQANLSKPVTNDPWLMNQFIHATRQFYPIAPHSVHISFQLRRRHRPAHNEPLPLSAMKCLFAIAGDPQPNNDGRIQIQRLVTEEIIRTKPKMHMLFSEISLRRSSDAEEDRAPRPGRRTTSKYVQQYKFLRLAPHLNYEVIALALKGVQITHKPGTFLTAQQYAGSPQHRALFEELLAWGHRPEPLACSEIERFLANVHDGLMTERRGKPAHRSAYIHWALSEIRHMLEEFNGTVARAPKRPRAARTV